MCSRVFFLDRPGVRILVLMVAGWLAGWWSCVDGKCTPRPVHIMYDDDGAAAHHYQCCWCLCWCALVRGCGSDSYATHTRARTHATAATTTSMRDRSVASLVAAVRTRNTFLLSIILRTRLFFCCVALAGSLECTRARSCAFYRCISHAIISLYALIVSSTRVVANAVVVYIIYESEHTHTHTRASAHKCELICQLVYVPCVRGGRGFAVWLPACMAEMSAIMRVRECGRHSRTRAHARPQHS